MNGDKIPADHGYPLRLIVPGYIGVRNCKWVCKLEISDEEAESHMQRRDYKMIKVQDWSQINFDDYASINANIPYACIASHKDGDTVQGSRVTLQGYANSNGENGAKVV